MSENWASMVVIVSSKVAIPLSLTMSTYRNTSYKTAEKRIWQESVVGARCAAEHTEIAAILLAITMIIRESRS
jgi:hypothetical protein